MQERTGFGGLFFGRGEGGERKATLTWSKEQRKQNHRQRYTVPKLPLSRGLWSASPHTNPFS